MAGGNGKNSLKSRKRAAQLKATEIQKAAEKKARYTRYAPRTEAPNFG